jgi:hypothetical protein
MEIIVSNLTRFLHRAWHANFFELQHCMKAALSEDMAVEEDVKALMASADTNGDRLLDRRSL